MANDDIILQSICVTHTACTYKMICVNYEKGHTDYIFTDLFLTKGCPAAAWFSSLWLPTISMLPLHIIPSFRFTTHFMPNASIILQTMTSRPLLSVMVYMFPISVTFPWSLWISWCFWWSPPVSIFLFVPFFYNYFLSFIISVWFNPRISSILTFAPKINYWF